uniref:Uncharacterized protein n=1 Tax=Anguilla anguilla TaxID=7936 RepID=A0A0E9R8P6_ANGAN
MTDTTMFIWFPFWSLSRPLLWQIAILSTL